MLRKTKKKHLNQTVQSIDSKDIKSDNDDDTNNLKKKKLNHAFDLKVDDILKIIEKSRNKKKKKVKTDTHTLMKEIICLAEDVKKEVDDFCKITDLVNPKNMFDFVEYIHTNK